MQAAEAGSGGERRAQSPWESEECRLIGPTACVYLIGLGVRAAHPG